ncbi:MAG: hypothetical protein ABIQ81_08155 [Novosphingobium sp.]
MSNAIRLALVLSAALGLSACASLTRGAKQNEPAGGNVSTSNGQKCITPSQLKLPRKTQFTADSSLPGYKPGSAQVTSAVSAGGIGGTAGNILLGGIIGVAVDGASGAMLDLSPNPLKWVMAPEGSAEETKIVVAPKPKTVPRKAPTRATSRKRTADATSPLQPQQQPESSAATPVAAAAAATPEG